MQQKYEKVMVIQALQVNYYGFSLIYSFILP